MTGNVGRQTSLYSFKSGGSAAPSSVGVPHVDPGLGGPSKLLSPQSSTLDRTVSKMSSLSHPTAGSQDFLEKFHSDRLDRQPTAPGAMPVPGHRNPPAWAADPFASPKAQEEDGSPLIRAGRAPQAFLGHELGQPSGSCARVEEDDREAGAPSTSGDTASLADALGHSPRDLQLLIKKLRTSIGALRDSISPQAPERARVHTRIPGPPLQRPARGLAPSLLRGASLASAGGQPPASGPREEVEVSDFEDEEAPAKEAPAPRLQIRSQPSRMAAAKQEPPIVAGPSSQPADAQPAKAQMPQEQARLSHAAQAARSSRGVHRKSAQGGTLNRKLRNLEAAWQELEAASGRKENEVAVSNEPLVGIALPQEAAALQSALEEPQLAAGKAADAAQAPVAPPAGPILLPEPQAVVADAAVVEAAVMPAIVSPAAAAAPLLPGLSATMPDAAVAVAKGQAAGRSAASKPAPAAPGISLPLPDAKPKKSLLKKLWGSSKGSSGGKAAAAPPVAVEGLRMQSELVSPKAERPAKSKDSFSKLAGLFRRRSFSVSPSPPPVPIAAAKAGAGGQRAPLPPAVTLPAVAASVPQLSGRTVSGIPRPPKSAAARDAAAATPPGIQTQASRLPPPPLRVLAQETAPPGPVPSMAADLPAISLPMSRQEATASAEPAAGTEADARSEASDASGADKGGAEGSWVSPERAVKSLLVPSWVPSKLPIRGIPPGEQAEGPLRSLESLQGSLIGALSPRAVTLMPRAKRLDWSAAKVPFSDFPVQSGASLAAAEPCQPTSTSQEQEAGPVSAPPMVQRAASSPQQQRLQPAPCELTASPRGERPASPPRPPPVRTQPARAKAPKEGFFKSLFKRRSDGAARAGKPAAGQQQQRRVTDSGAALTVSYNRLPSMTAPSLSARTAAERPSPPLQSAPAGASASLPLSATQEQTSQPALPEQQQGPVAAAAEEFTFQASPPVGLSPRPERGRTPSAGRRRMTDEELDFLHSNYQSLAQTLDRLPARAPSRERQRDSGPARRRLPQAAAYERAAGMAVPSPDSVVGTTEAVPCIMRKLAQPVAEPRPAAERPQEEARWEPESASLTASRWAESLRSPTPPQRAEAGAGSGVANLAEARLALRLGQRATTPFGRVRCEPERAVPVAGSRGVPAQQEASGPVQEEHCRADGAPMQATPAVQSPSRPPALIVDSLRPAFPALKAYLGAKSPAASPSRDLAADPEIAACQGSAARQRRFQEAGLLESHVVALQKQFEGFSTARDRTAAWATQSTAHFPPAGDQNGRAGTAIVAGRSASASTRGSASPDSKAAAKPVRIKY